MTEVRFYHLQRQTQEQVLPVLLSKALERGHKIVVKLADEGAVAAMNEHLWTFSPNSFIPHGSVKEGDAPLQPVWLTAVDENPNEADVLILGVGAQSEMQGNFALCCEMLNGHDEGAVQVARGRWKEYQGQKFDVTYWQQSERGGWEKKA